MMNLIGNKHILNVEIWKDLSKKKIHLKIGDLFEIIFYPESSEENRG
ncbi:MAG: hypothetical protein ACC612_10275 [Methanomethylovorans sp.]